MAASREERDYYHIVKRYIESQKQEYNVISNCFNYYVWEVQSYDRDETFSLLDNYLSEDLKLVTIQLGENVVECETYKKDYISLIEHIKKYSPLCKIILIGDFWWSDKRGDIKRVIARETNSVYISLQKIQNKEKYACNIGAKVYDKEGNIHDVEHAGVARHPNDLAMEYIADEIILRLKLLKI